MADPISLTMAAVGIAGAATSAYGAYSAGQAQGAAADYQAQVARNNALIAEQNVAMTQAAGAAKESAEGMKTRAAGGAVKAAQGASNIDVNSGSAERVQEAVGKLGAVDIGTTRSNVAKEAYGYRVAAVSDTAQAQLDTMEAGQARQAGDISALGTFLSGASSVGSKFAPMQNLGSIGSAANWNTSLPSGSLTGF